MVQCEKMSASYYQILSLVMYFCEFGNLKSDFSKSWPNSLCTRLACSCKENCMLNSSTNNQSQKKQIILTICNNSALVFDLALKGKVPVVCHSFLSTWEEVYS